MENNELNRLAQFMQQQIEILEKLMSDQSDFPVYQPVEYHTTSPRDFDLYCYANELRDGFSTHSYVAPDNEVVFVAKMIRP